jgi:hypothetical protein
MGNERKNVMWYILRRNYFKEMGNTTDIWGGISGWNLSQIHLKLKSGALLLAQQTMALCRNGVGVLVTGKELLTCCKFFVSESTVLIFKNQSLSKLCIKMQFLPHREHSLYPLQRPMSPCYLEK